MDLASSAAEQLARYDGLLMWGDCLDPSHADDLRGLARVFDLDVPADIPLPRLWARLRPLIEGSAP